MAVGMSSCSSVIADVVEQTDEQELIPAGVPLATPLGLASEARFTGERHPRNLHNLYINGCSALSPIITVLKNV
jgi:hypothetical protein